MWLAILSDQLPVVALVVRYTANELICREPLRTPRGRLRAPGLPPGGLPPGGVRGITRPLGRLSPAPGQVAHVLRTRPPVGYRYPPMTCMC